MKKSYLVALPTFKGAKGWCHQTILVSALNENDAIKIVKHLKPHDNIGDIKIVNYQGTKMKDILISAFLLLFCAVVVVMILFEVSL